MYLCKTDRQSRTPLASSFFSVAQSLIGQCSGLSLLVGRLYSQRMDSLSLNPGPGIETPFLGQGKMGFGKRPMYTCTCSGMSGLSLVLVMHANYMKIILMLIAVQECLSSLSSTCSEQ